MKLVRGRGCDFEKVSDLGKASDLGKVNDLGKACDFGKISDFGKLSDFKKVSNLRKARDFEKVGDLEKATYLSLSATVVLIYGKTKKAHDEALECCLKRLADFNLKAKGSKCSFLQKELKFYRLIFSGDGTRPNPERIENLVKVSRPTNAAEVRSSSEWSMHAVTIFTSMHRYET